jgi:membrane protein
VAHSITLIGYVLVVISALSFARALQRVYELSYELPSVGIRATHWHLLWIALIPVYITLRPLVAGFSGGWWRIAGSLLLGGVAWLTTPYILLGRRIRWRRLLPGALLGAFSMSVLSAASLIYLPHSVSTSAERFGAIGVAFAMLSWLVLAGFVIIGAATAGAVALEQLEAPL